MFSGLIVRGPTSAPGRTVQHCAREMKHGLKQKLFILRQASLQTEIYLQEVSFLHLRLRHKCQLLPLEIHILLIQTEDLLLYTLHFCIR